MGFFHLFHFFSKHLQPTRLKFYMSFCYDNMLLNMQDRVSSVCNQVSLGMNFELLMCFLNFFSKNNFWPINIFWNYFLTLKLSWNFFDQRSFYHLFHHKFFNPNNFVPKNVLPKFLFWPKNLFAQKVLIDKIAAIDISIRVHCVLIFEIFTFTN